MAGFLVTPAGGIPALIDRLTYQAHIFEFRGQSYRFQHHSQEVVAKPTTT
jgi:hypothetical protein